MKPEQTLGWMRDIDRSPVRLHAVRASIDWKEDSWRKGYDNFWSAVDSDEAVITRQMNAIELRALQSRERMEAAEKVLAEKDVEIKRLREALEAADDRYRCLQSGVK